MKITDANPFFSIVLPTRNRPDLISSFIKCTLDQTFQNFELIICDNSSNELTQQAISEFSDDRIVNLRAGGLKMSDNWNYGIHAISGQYLLLISDKGLLKQGSLEYLFSLIEEEKHDCITWRLDPFVDPDTLIVLKPSQYSKKVNSNDLIKIMLGADWEGFDIAPMHCTSCVSAKIVADIISKHKNLSQELNPDYTMAIQILLATPYVYHINQNLMMLRRPSLLEGYGNGSSFVKKTSQSKAFMAEHADWIERTNQYSDIPIQNNHFVLDIMLKDVYKVLIDNKINPNSFLPRRERLIAYYHFTFLEILWRTRIGINMSHEYKMWNKSLEQESQDIRRHVMKQKKQLRLKSLQANLIYSIKTHSFTIVLLKAFRAIKYKNIGLKYGSIDDCFRENLIKSYNDSSNPNELKS